jgi:DMSO/TMAO reductase YedYZ molybdopterin-dependent catalytic subunit
VTARTRTGWRVAGGLAGAFALSFLWAANRIEPAVPFPPLLVAERIIRLTPGDLATFFIDTLGPNAVRLLAVGSIIGFLVVAALLPEATAAGSRARPYRAGAVVAILSAFSGFFAPSAPPPAATVLGSLAGGSLYAVSMAWFADENKGNADLSRRRALISLGAVAVGFAVGGTLLARAARRLEGPDTDVAIRAPDEPAGLPKGTEFPEIPDLSAEVTAVADHYVVDIDLMDPVVKADGWILRIGGMVQTPTDLTLSTLQSFTIVEEYSVLTCISNPVGGDLVGSSAWTGVRLGEVLSRAGTLEDAVDVVFRCADGYSDSIPVEVAFDLSVILAIGQNGQPLTWEHGFPCRVRVPSVYGMKNVKWLEEIEVAGRDYRGYWEQRGWSDVATVRTQSRIDVVGPNLIAGRPAWVAGVAWAGDRGVSSVQISVDGGRTWQEAMLRAPVSGIAWTQWALRWSPPAPGSYRIVCRAVDGDGRRQEATERPPHPSGASGYHEVEAEVT